MDATGIFEEVHARGILLAYGPTFCIGRLSGAAVPRQSVGGPAAQPQQIVGTGPLDSPFPAEQFDGGALAEVEAFKFQWAAAAELLRREDGQPGSRPVPKEEKWHVHRAKSYVNPMNVE